MFKNGGIVCASDEVLKLISGRQIIGILNMYGLDYYRRRGMLRASGKRYLISTPEETEKRTGKFKQIGGWLEK